MIWGVLAILLLGVAWAFAYAHAVGTKSATKARSQSNARVLKEYKNLTIHRPNHIVDYEIPRRQIPGERLGMNREQEE